MEIPWVQKSAPKYIMEGAKICTIKLYIHFNLSIHNINLQVPFFSYCKIWFAVIIHDYIYLREPWSFKKAICFSTDNTSSPHSSGLLPGRRKGRNSSTTDCTVHSQVLLSLSFRQNSIKQVKPPLFCPSRISSHSTSTTVNSCWCVEVVQQRCCLDS